MKPEAPATVAAAQGGLEADLEDERYRFALLSAGLDLIDQGLTVIDKELRIVACNRRLLTLYGLPPELGRVGTPFSALMRYNAERGEYGDGDVEQIVAERVALARQFKPHDIERVRPDGSIVAVRGEPLPHGGWVTLYTDITRQRSYERRIEQQNQDLDRRVRDRTAALEAVNAELQHANAEQKRLEAVLVHAQKMEAVGELTGGLAHDFNNLLTIIISNLASLRDRAGQVTGAMEFVEPALVAALKGADITRRLLAFARRQALEPRVVEVNRLVADLLALSRHSLPEPIRIASEPAPTELFTRVDPQQLEHALLNLLLNARDAMPHGGSLSVRSLARTIRDDDDAELELEPGAYVEILVADTGGGMDEATLSRAFEPFFTTKQFGAGSGLGLSMVYGFVKQSGGAVRITSIPGRGTTVALLLPACAPPVEREAPSSERAHARGHSPRLVLLVEDDAEVRTVLRRQLTDIGHMVIEAPAGDEALAIVQGVPELSVLVSDIVMPGAMDGRRLAALAKARRPDLKVVLVTGYAEGLDAQADRPFTVLRKPCTKEELAIAIEASQG